MDWWGMVTGMLGALALATALGAVAWWMLKPRDPKWLREVEHREHALKEVLPTIVEEKPLMSAVPYRDLVKQQYAQLADWARSPDGSMIVVNVYDSDQPALNGTALAGLKARIGRFAEMGHAACRIEVRPRGYASGLLVEARLLRS